MDYFFAYFFENANTITMKLKQGITGIIIGGINSLLGAGGGLVTVPYLATQGLSQQQAQATSTFVILPLTVLSTFLYGRHNLFSLQEAWVFLPGGIIGAGLGGIFLNKIPPKPLKLIFSAFMLWAGVRLLWK
ncbi:MAG: sulfite exporter TauE/SafE family protein [Clostridia bacterium]|nr:sulfite exporter TauE/SafE family protein [Clostridia bacterium]